jgi:hypothetical protein
MANSDSQFPHPSGFVAKHPSITVYQRLATDGVRDLWRNDQFAEQPACLHALEPIERAIQRHNIVD